MFANMMCNKFSGCSRFAKQLTTPEGITMLKGGKPVYEEPYFDNIVISNLEFTTQKPISELIESGAITPLTIQDMSDKLKQRMYGDIKKNILDNVEKGAISKLGNEEDEVFIGEIYDTDILYGLANKLVGKHLKEHNIPEAY